MAFGVFIHRQDSIYDDSPAERYQFPCQYLGRVQACIDDWIIYYEPRKVAATRGHFAVANVQQAIPDPAAPRHANDPDGIRSFINKTGRALPPLRAHDRPHPHFLQWHRENCFKQ